MTVRVDYSDDGAVGGRLITFERERSLFPAAPENKLADTATDGIKRNRWLPFGFEVAVECLHDQKLPPVKRFVLHGRNNITDDACDLHYVTLFTSAIVAFLLPKTPTLNT